MRISVFYVLLAYSGNINRYIRIIFRPQAVETERKREKRANELLDFSFELHDRCSNLMQVFN